MKLKYTFKPYILGTALGLTMLLGTTLTLHALGKEYTAELKPIPPTEAASVSLPNPLPLEATLIKVNGQPVVSVSSKEVAEKTLEKIKTMALGEKYASLDIVSQNFIEKVESAQVLHDLSPISNEEEALKILLDPVDEKNAYTVKEGDTFWSIADAHHLTVEQLLEANTDLDPELINIEDKIYVTTSHPLLHTKTIGRLRYEESIPFDTVEVEDPTLSIHTTKLLTPGQEGTKEVYAEVTLENDELKNEKVLNEKILKSPVIQKVSKGTKPASINDVSYLPRPAFGPITSGFGRRWGRMHNGIDIAVPIGSPVKAIFDGVISFAGYNGAYGKLVIIQHTDGYSTYYAHNSSIHVSVGEKVNQGEAIASSGSTGRSTGPHVHLEIRKNGSPMDPRKYVN